MTMPAALRSRAGGIFEIEGEGFSREDEKVLPGGENTLLLDIPGQFNGEEEKWSLTFCAGDILVAKPFYQLVEADFNITCICSMYIKLF